MIVDIHVHPYLGAQRGDFAGISQEAAKFDARLCVFSVQHRQAKTADWKPTAAYCRRANDEVATIRQRYPDQVYTFAYVNPLNGEAALGELDRCVREQGMVGMKLWIAVRCIDPVLDPLMERCAAYGIPTLQHTWLKTTGNYPGESTPQDLVELARRHPRNILIMGHSGGDWEYGFRCARHLENVYFDIGGGEANSGSIERAVDLVGAERILFGSDMPGRSLTSQLAKVLGAAIGDDAKEKILYRNALSILGEPK